MLVIFFFFLHFDFTAKSVVIKNEAEEGKSALWHSLAALENLFCSVKTWRGRLRSPKAEE